jgi:hypothetical protein
VPGPSGAQRRQRDRIDAVLKLYNDRMKQAKKEDQQKEEDILVMESAEPLPIVHDDGCLRWQNEIVGQGRTDSSSVGQGRADSSSVGQGREDSSSVG